MMGKFHYLKYGLGSVLAFVGVKMLLSDVYKFPIPISLGVIAVLLVGSIVASLVWPQPIELPKPAPQEGPKAEAQ
jgi:tellurite resistance protein TerC